MHEFLIIGRTGWRWETHYPTRGRPRSITDMRAYKAEKAKVYRKKKAQEAKP